MLRAIVPFFARACILLLFLAVCFAVLSPNTAMAHGGMAAPGVSVNASDTEEAARSDAREVECCHMSSTCITFAVVLSADSPAREPARLMQVKPGSAMWQASWLTTADPPPPRS